MGGAQLTLEPQLLQNLASLRFSLLHLEQVIVLQLARAPPPTWNTEGALKKMKQKSTKS